MKKIIVLHTIVFILFFGIALSFGQTVSEEAKRHFDRGMAAVEMAKSPEDYKAAIKEFEQAARLAPDWPDVYYNLGMVQEKAEKYSDAIRSLKQYLRLAPNASDAETVKTLINKLEYKQDQEEGVKRVYEMMTSGIYEKEEVDRKKLSGEGWESELGLGPDRFGLLLQNFRTVSGKMQARNQWSQMQYNYAVKYAGYPPPIPRKWEPVKVNGRFYEYTFSDYMAHANGYVIRRDYEVKGEIISIDPPRVKEILKGSITWGVPTLKNMTPWQSSWIYEGAMEYVYELIAKDLTPLELAVLGGRKDVVESLIAKGADINAKNKYGDTPLITAVFNNKTEMAELLIAKGADINAKNPIGLTPLHLAAGGGLKEVAELLIAKGADINAKDQLLGLTPLHLAADGGLKEVAELLIAKGADINAKDKDGKTPLQLAEDNLHMDVADLLKKHGARK
jgi:tetratricopeptide (TPR) repeat protein